MRITKHKFQGNGRTRVGYTVSNENVSFFIHPGGYDEHYNDQIIDEGLHLEKEALELFLKTNFSDSANTLNEALVKHEEYADVDKKIINSITEEDFSDL